MRCKFLQQAVFPNLSLFHKLTYSVSHCSDHAHSTMSLPNVGSTWAVFADPPAFLMDSPPVTPATAVQKIKPVGFEQILDFQFLVANSCALGAYNSVRGLCGGVGITEFPALRKPLDLTQRPPRRARALVV
jgi:hypothetical protein